MKFKRILSTVIAVTMAVVLIPNLSFASETENSDMVTTTNIFEATRTDFRDESVYSLLITRFYDGDSGNNVHCWDDAQAGNPDDDPAWRGDFKGLIEKLDYIKALGFTAVQLNTVAQNASGYDYHGEHPVDQMRIDVRYGSEKEGYTYEDLINACHSKGLKVIQNVQINSSSNFGDTYLSHMFDINTSADADLGTIEGMMVPKKDFLDAFGLSSADEYWAQKPATQYQQRVNYMKNTTYTSAESNTYGSLPGDADYAETKLSSSDVYNPNNYYHSGYFQSLNWDDWSCKYAQLAADSVDINTENYIVGQYLAEACKMYADYGVDAIYIDDARHMNRLSLNLNIIEPLKKMLADEGLHMDIFAEVVTRYSQTWYRDHATESTPFYTWADDDKWETKWKYDGSAESVNNNMNVSFDFIKENDDVTNQPTSDNAFLNGIEYHAPDYTKSSGVNVFDFTMHRVFASASNAFGIAKSGDRYYNDSTWNITGVETQDYSPEIPDEKTRFSGGTDTWLENLTLMFTFRGIPRILYGTEVEFQKESVIDIGPNTPLSNTGRAYYGDNIEGKVTTTNFGEYNASGTVAETLSAPISTRLRQLNEIRQKVPALRKGQYTTDSKYVSGDMAFIRRYTDEAVDSLALVAISGDAQFNNIPNGRYVDAVTGNEVYVTDNTLSVNLEQGDFAVYVCSADGFMSLDAELEVSGSYSVAFDANGGEGTMQNVTSSYELVKLPKCTFMPPEGKTFKAWSIGDKEYSAGSYIELTEDVTAKAIWRDAGPYDVSFASDGGIGDMPSISVADGDYVLPKCSFNAPFGKSFKAWSIGDSEYSAGETVEIIADTEIKALWQDITISLTAQSVKATGLPKSAKLILSSYLGKELIDIKSFDVSGSFDKTIAEAGLNITDADTVKAFLWKDTVNIFPLCYFETVSINAEEPIVDGKIYFENSDGWAKVNVYYWSSSNTSFVSWPGTAMENISGTNIWSYKLPEGVTYVIFNNGSTQTSDLLIPADGSNLYSYGSGSWSKYQ